MGKVYLLCGKICSGKSFYSKKLQRETGAVIFSPDEVTYDLIQNEQGEFYNIFVERVIKYLDKKSAEIALAGADVIYDRGLWTKRERERTRKYYRDRDVKTELHYVSVSDERWKRQIEKRNREILSGENTKDFYIDEGLMNKFISLFEEPSEEEYDVLIENR